MYYFLRYFLVLFFCGLFISCSEKISYTGKIINYDFFDYTTINNKNEVLNILGQPNFIDPIEKKYYFFSEKKNEKNFFDKKIENRTMLVFEFNENDTIKSFSKYNLNDQKTIDYIKDTTEHRITERGLIEKIFGGVGVGANLPNSTE